MGEDAAKKFKRFFIFFMPKVWYTVVNLCFSSRSGDLTMDSVLFLRLSSNVRPVRQELLSGGTGKSGAAKNLNFKRKVGSPCRSDMMQ